MRRVGSTQVGPIVGVSKWANARDVFEDLVHDIRPAPKKVFERGTKYEPVMRETYRREVGPVGEAPCTRYEPLLHPSWAFASASPDGFVGDDTVVEFKTASIWAQGEWGLPGTDEVPPVYLCQLAWCMAVTGRSVAHLLVGFGNDDPATDEFFITENRLFVVERDLELEETLRVQVEEFWRRHVVPRVPPELEPLGAIKRQLAKLEKEQERYERIKQQFREHLGIGEGVGQGAG